MSGRESPSIQRREGLSRRQPNKSPTNYTTVSLLLTSCPMGDSPSAPSLSETQPARPPFSYVLRLPPTLRDRRALSSGGNETASPLQRNVDEDSEMVASRLAESSRPALRREVGDDETAAERIPVRIGSSSRGKNAEGTRHDGPGQIARTRYTRAATDGSARSNRNNTKCSRTIKVHRGFEMEPPWIEPPQILKLWVSRMSVGANSQPKRWIFQI